MSGPMQQPTTWDAVAPAFAMEYSTPMRPYADEALRRVPVGRSDHVLDLAAGAGLVTFAAAPRVSRVTAVDFSPGMIDELRARAARDGVDNIDAAVMDAHHLELPDAAFDAAFCLFSFMFFSDRARVFAELHRVLRPGGRALIATWAPIDRRPYMQLGFDAVAEAFPDLPRPGKGDLQAPDECVAEMSAAGFRDVTAARFTVAMPVRSVDEYVATLTRGNAALLLHGRRLGADAGAATARLTDAVRRRLPDGGADLDAESILTWGSR
jgi:ubiquinone/menaquinone biosynthesis C-methylase UbiE